MSGGLQTVLPLVLLVFLGYVLLIRPARRRAQAATHLQSALSPGDQVMLTSGMFATVVSLQDEIARVEIADGVVISVHRRAVGQIITEPLPAIDDPELDPTPETGGIPGDENPGVN